MQYVCSLIQQQEAKLNMRYEICYAIACKLIYDHELIIELENVSERSIRKQIRMSHRKVDW